MIEFFLPVTIVIIPDVMVTNAITKLYQSCLVVMASQTMLAGMKFSITQAWFAGLLTLVWDNSAHT